MPSYLALGNFTKQGVDDIANLENRIAAAKSGFSDAGGRMIFFYLTFGQYDFAAVVELPDDETAARAALAQAQLGNNVVKTQRAFTEEEAIAIANSVGD